MDMSSGYYYPDSFDHKDLEHPFSVYSCGHYRLSPGEVHHTIRPHGRLDYQLLYVAGGSAYFTLSDGCHKAMPGDAVIYLPEQPQDYQYISDDHPELFWMHFSGSQAEALLKELKMDQDIVYHVSFQSEYTTLFHRIIRELQLCGPHYYALVNALAQELLLLMSRSFLESDGKLRLRNQQIQQAISIIHEDCRQERSTVDLAREANMSACWFIRSFKEYTGLSPQQYIIRARMNKARELLSSTNNNISEVALMVGYENPLYFSRLFKKHVGLSPREYKQRQGNSLP